MKKIDTIPTPIAISLSNYAWNKLVKLTKSMMLPESAIVRFALSSLYMEGLSGVLDIINLSNELGPNRKNVFKPKLYLEYLTMLGSLAWAIGCTQDEVIEVAIVRYKGDSDAT